MIWAFHIAFRTRTQALISSMCLSSTIISVQDLLTESAEHIAIWMATVGSFVVLGLWVKAYSLSVWSGWCIHFLIWCGLSIQSPTQYIHSIFMVYVQYIQSICIVYAQYLHSIYMVHAQYIHGIYMVYVQYIMVYAQYIDSTCMVYTQYMHSISQYIHSIFLCSHQYL